ncbi:MAG TPA: hypothetical protein DCE43_06110 [Planctomycetaceae bacterium]|nr:hypothetical protein [Planctomycetaceae bacterium]
MKLQVIQGGLAKLEFQSRAEWTGSQCHAPQQHGTSQEDERPFGPWFLFGHDGARNRGNTRREIHLFAIRSTQPADWGRNNRLSLAGTRLPDSVLDSTAQLGRAPSVADVVP